MITLEQAIELATKAHSGQFRKPIKFLNTLHELENYEITKMQHYRKEIIKNNIKYTMDENLQIWKHKPYIIHPLVVMDMMQTEQEKILAVLHDVVEDCEGWDLNTNYSNKYFWLISPEGTEYELTYEIYMGLKWLTHKSSESYLEYIKMIAEQEYKSVIKVKLADVCHNLSDNPSKNQKEKYLKAMPILLGAL